MSFRSPSDRTEPPAPWIPRYVMSADPVAKVAVRSEPALLKATTYSWPDAASVRVKA